MNPQLYIPKKIKVGYQKREDTYTKKLSYIIYYDDKGILRKEKSWQHWRDKKIDVDEFENKPQSGLVLNKDIKRYNWGHFSSNRTMIRVYDPRGIEFEITTENLIGVLMNSDCLKRGLTGEFVYAWHGPELVLLPTECEEYQKAINYTNLQSGKVGVKDLVAGCSYKTKKEGDVIYIGRYDWYKFDYKYNWRQPDKMEEIIRKSKKHHIFYIKNNYNDEFNFYPKSSLEFLATKNSDQPVSNFSELIEEFQKNIHSSPIVGIDLKPEKIEYSIDKHSTDNYLVLNKRVFHKIENDIITQYNVELDQEYNREKKEYEFKSIKCQECGSANPYGRFDIKTLKFLLPSAQYTQSSYGRTYVYPERKKYSLQEINSLGFCDIYVKLQNGKKSKTDSLNTLVTIY